MPPSPAYSLFVMQWINGRLTALVDNLLWALVLLVVAAVGASIWAWGGEEADLPIWLVVLFGAVQAACVIALIVLFVRSRAPRMSSEAQRPVVQLPPDPPHPHAQVLDQIDALRSDLEGQDYYEPVPWTTAQDFNALLANAQLSTQSGDLHRFQELVRDPNDLEYGNTTVGPLRTTLGQIRTIVKHST